MSYPQYLNPPEIKWVTPNIIARTSRPGYPCDEPYREEVNAWIETVKSMGIRSVLCLLSAVELEEYYQARGIPLLELYAEAGLTVHHFPIEDHLHPPLTTGEAAKVMQLLKTSEKPVVVHCSAGMDRTGHVISAWQRQQS